VQLGESAVELSQRRREVAQRLAAGIETELHDLRMEGARFGVSFQWQEDPDGVPLPQPVSRLTAHVHVRASRRLNPRALNLRLFHG